MLLVKTAHAAMTAVECHKDTHFPLNIYGEADSVYSGPRRGRTNRVSDDGGKQVVRSNNIGIMRSYMPVSRDDVLFEEPSMETANQYRRPADASTYVAGADMPEKFFSSEVSPFVNSISGTMLCQLRVMAKLLEEHKLEYENNPEQLKTFFKCFISYMIYNSGGHSLQEFTGVFQLPQVQAMFKDIPGFTDLNLRQLFQTENDASFMSAMDRAIDYNDKLFMRNAVHAELTSTTAESEARATKLSDIEARISENWKKYRAPKTGEEKFAAKQYLLSEEARAFYRERFCNADGEIKRPTRYAANGSVAAYETLVFDRLKGEELQRVIFDKLRYEVFLHHDEATANVRAKLTPARREFVPIQERIDSALDCLQTGKDSADKQNAAALFIIKQINAAKRMRHEDPETFLSEDEGSAQKVREVFSKLKGESPSFGAEVSAEDAELNASVLDYLESIREKKKAGFYQVSSEAPSFASLLDKAYAVYTDEHAHLMDKEIAQEFIIYALDIQNPAFKLNEQIETAMALRALIKDKNPNFIPGRSPLPRDVLAPEVLAAVSQTARFRKTDNPTIRSMFESSELLDVITQAKQKDRGGKHGKNQKTIFFNPLERDSFRVDIHRGLFMRMGEPISTHDSMSHGKKGFAAFTLDVNGELSVFPHIDHDKTGIAHSSMNEGRPVVCAGEVQIENGKLKAITTYSGHYRPTLYNIYKALDYFQRRGVDVSEAKLYSFENPAVMNIAAKPSPYPRFYESQAQDLLQTYKATLRKELHAIKQDIMDYKTKREGLWHTIFHKTALTEEKLKIAKALIEYLETQEQALNRIDNLQDYERFLIQLESIVTTMDKENRDVSSHHNRREGLLAEKLTSFTEKIQASKSVLRAVREGHDLPDDRDLNSEERTTALKGLGRRQS
ncbi:Uncharacterised protein [Legionella longbeachae]|nr:hypothetical protein Loak_0613 [Legionella oakridgensis]STY20429.1 Uncharacterised protein [Legionella longbeachae]